LEFPYLKRALEDVLEEYSSKGLGVPEGEVVRIFRAVAEALLFLQKNGSCHGDVKSSNIVFDHRGTPKLMDSYFINGGKTAYEIVLENPSSMSLLAPEQMARIKHRQNEDLSTIHASEVFMLGLTMLEAMTFENAMECYNLENLEIVDGYLQRKRKELGESGYSPQLCSLALRCLSL
jgi:serine/threonine protein kinase